MRVDRLMQRKRGWVPNAAGVYVPAPATGTLNLDFTTGSMPAGTTFTRASTGWYVNSSGNLVSAAVDTARLDYAPTGLASRGILIEPAATNLATQSNTFTNAAWTKSNASVAQNVVGPEGSANSATTMTNDATNSFHRAYQGVTSGVHANSIYAKAGTASFMLLSSFVGTGNGVIFNLSTGAIDTTLGSDVGYIEDAGNGWYRCSVYNPSSSGFHIFYIGETAGQLNPIDTAYVGTSKTILLYGAQAELASAANKLTSYIPTLGSTVTRSADNLGFTIPSGISNLTYTFDDSSTQVVAVTPGAYTVPTNLNRPRIKTIVGS